MSKVCNPVFELQNSQLPFIDIRIYIDYYSSITSANVGGKEWEVVKLLAFFCCLLSQLR